MIKLEDEELEKFVLGGQSCIAVPIEVFITADTSAEALITSYRACCEIAAKFEERFKGRYLSDDAKLWLNKELLPFAENIGYRSFDSENSVMLEYEMTSCSQLNKMLKNDNCIMISDNDVLAELCRNTCCDIEINGGDDVIFAVVEDGVILSYAGVNDLEFDGKSLEISVETMPSEMGKGYGSACVTALCEYLLGKGYHVLYKCSSSNAASAALAEKCGFSLVGTRYSATYEKI